MNIDELITKINYAVDDCQIIIKQHPNVVLSESDFERLLCRQISKRLDEHIEQVPEPGDFSVHTQISYYLQEDKVEYRVDILVLDESLIDDYKKHKGGRYFGSSVALELKYLRLDDPVSIVEKDFQKWDTIKDDSSLFVVALIDSKDEEDFKTKKQRIEEIGDEVCPNKENNNLQKLFCKCLEKRIKEI